jgi:long-chain acyl-CoA synthetase
MNQFSRKYLAAYKAPRYYEFRQELPKTAVVKILRRMLVEEEKQKIEEESQTHAYIMVIASSFF